MPLFMYKPVSGRYLSFAEREEIGLLRAQDVGVREIARRIGRSPSTVSRELKRNAATRGGKLEYGLVPRTKNGPALGGYGAVTMANALKKTVTTLPAHLKQSLTWDRGKELSDHARFTIESGVKVFFADPRSPWQRGTNENTNGLLRQYFAKGTDLSRWSDQEIHAVANALNTRPRKTLGWRTPAEALNEYLKSSQQPSVATTG